jgi:polyphenol oxidase
MAETGAVETVDLALVPDWPAPPGVKAGATLRRGGVSTGPYASLNVGAHVGDAPEAVAENRRCVARALALPAEPCWLEQAHGRLVLDLDAELDGAAGAQAAQARSAVTPPGKAVYRPPAGPVRPPADGAVTSRPGVVCAVMTADCLPVLLTDRQGRRVGVAHAGWRGLARGVLPAAVAALGAPPEDVLAWLGPAIGPSAFEVGDEVRAAFDAAGFGVDASFARNARGRWQADLYALATQSLGRAGVAAVYGGGFCTYREHDRFFSHRREAPCGRMATLIWID